MRLQWHMCRWHRNSKLRCFMFIVILLLLSLWPISMLLSQSEDSFPYEDFIAHWNISPFCGNKSSSSLTRRIHLMYKTELIPTAYSAYVRSWARDYPEFELHFWTDKGIDSFLSGQFGLRMTKFFNSQLAHGVERADVARLLILNHFGGLYVDLDVMSLRSAKAVMEQHRIVFTEEPRPHAVFLYSQPSLISNAVLYSTPCHRFWRHYFVVFPAQLHAEYGGPHRLRMRRLHRHLAVFATGPKVLDSIARSFFETALSSSNDILVAPPELFQPVFDAAAPSLDRIRWQCGASLLRYVLLSRLQLQQCSRFLQRPDSFVNKSVAAFARHDFLHLGYHHKAKESLVRVESLLSGVVLH